MSVISNKDFILAVLSVLNKKNIKSTKIFLHKFIYFLTLQNFVRTFKFEPYSYGPFSFNLARDIESLVFWDEVINNGAEINLVSSKDIEHDSSLHTVISENADSFLNILENDVSFNNLERIGTVLYCMEVLKIAEPNENFTFNKVKEEFKGWKREKYSSDEIQAAFDKVNSCLPKALM